jgi:ACS family D-galactonate transporter-like MFS transporter
MSTAIEAPAEPIPQAAPRTRVRFFILALLSVGVLTNYLDRAVISIAAPSFQKEFALSAEMMGVVFSAFSWTYFLAQIPGGVLLDRFGNRVIYLFALTFWSLFTLLQAFANGAAAMIGFRCGLGLSEAPCFPANNNIVGMWFPRSERARAIGVYTAAEYVGLGFLTPLLFWILASSGWRALFAWTGGAGLVFAVIWWLFYREPYESRAVNAAELDYIRQGGGLVGSETKGTKFELRLIRELFRHRQMWGLCIGQFSVYSTFVFFLTWFPTYLATARHMAWIKVGFFTSLPYIAGFFGILFAGWWSDYMLRRGVSLNVARKLPVITGLVLASTIVACNWVDNDNIVIAILSLAFFAQSMSSSGWSVLSEVTPPGLLGLVGGLFNASANLSGIVIPLVIGVIVQQTGSFVDALGFVGAVAAVGALSWIFVIGDLKRMHVATAPVAT